MWIFKKRKIREIRIQFSFLNYFNFQYISFLFKDFHTSSIQTFVVVYGVHVYMLSTCSYLSFFTIDLHTTWNRNPEESLKTVIATGCVLIVGTNMFLKTLYKAITPLLDRLRQRFRVIWLSYVSDRHIVWLSYGSDHYMDLTVLWIWPLYESDRPMDLTIIWIWPSYGSDHYMNLTVIWIWPWNGSDRHMDLTILWIWLSYGSDCHMNLTALWIWPSYGSDNPMDLTVIWIWPSYGSDHYMDLTILWIWPSYGSNNPMDLTIIWIWPSYGSDRPKHSYEPNPAQWKILIVTAHDLLIYL